jgi:hypothetical protein
MFHPSIQWRYSPNRALASLYLLPPQCSIISGQLPVAKHGIILKFINDLEAETEGSVSAISKPTIGHQRTHAKTKGWEHMKAHRTRPVTQTDGNCSQRRSKRSNTCSLGDQSGVGYLPACRCIPSIALITTIIWRRSQRNTVYAFPGFIPCCNETVCVKTLHISCWPLILTGEEWSRSHHAPHRTRHDCRVFPWLMKLDRRYLGLLSEFQTGRLIFYTSVWSQAKMLPFHFNLGLSRGRFPIGNLINSTFRLLSSGVWRHVTV